VVYCGYRRDRGLYVISMMHLREYESSPYTCSGIRAVIICVTESVNRRRHSTTNGLKALNLSRGHEFFLALVKSISSVRNSWQKMTCAHTLTTRRVVFVIYRKFGERARNIRESHRQKRNAATCTIYSVDLFLFVLE